MPEPAKTLVLRENPRMLEFRDLLYRYKDRFAKVLPQSMPVDKLMQLGLVTMGQDSKLLACTAQSVLRAVMLAAQLGLDPTGAGGQAYILPYGTTARLIPGYRGLLDLARRSGIVVGVDAHVVHKADVFEVQHGTEPSILHRPTIEGDPGPLIAAYAIVRVRGDIKPMQEVMTKRDIDWIRSLSRARDGDAWTKHYDEMARKTVLRRILKLAPSSIEQLNRAMDEEDQAERGETIPADFSDLGVMPMLDDDQPDPAMTKSDELAQKLQEGREKGGAAET